MIKLKIVHLAFNGIVYFLYFGVYRLENAKPRIEKGLDKNKGFDGLVLGVVAGENQKIIFS